MRLILLVLFVTMSITKSKAQEIWQLAKDKDGIKVYVSEVTNCDYYAFKAVMSVRTIESKIVEILKDANNYSDWFAFTASAKLISQTENEQIVFIETDYPWPFSNECMNYKMVFEKLQNDKLKISIVGINSTVKCDYSLKKANGYILLEPENVNIKITYYFHSEPSQKIRPWLINPRVHEMPFQTFKGLRKKLGKKISIQSP
jgi:hypothetical protein